MFTIEINAIIFSVTAIELKNIRAKGIVVAFVL